MSVQGWHHEEERPFDHEQRPRIITKIVTYTGGCEPCGGGACQGHREEVLLEGPQRRHGDQRTGSAVQAVLEVGLVVAWVETGLLFLGMVLSGLLTSSPSLEDVVRVALVFAVLTLGVTAHFVGCAVSAREVQA